MNSINGIPRQNINLSHPAKKRWELSTDQISKAKVLFKTYLDDLGYQPSYDEIVAEFCKLSMKRIYNEELDEISKILGVPSEQTKIVNLYYDALKIYIGCTAFAFESDNGPIHARNLDWWTQDNILSTYSQIYDFTGVAAGDFTAISWPGFTGILSGTAKGRFSITLNAVLSEEPFIMEKPITYLIREAFETCKNYEQAIELLSKTKICSDCLLLVTGTKNNEIAVIERTPTTSNIRKSQDGFIAVTNDYYKNLNKPKSNLDNPLMETSCRRYEEICNLLNQKFPKNLDECIDYLSNSSIKMLITVQQMAFQASTGKFTARMA